MSERLYDSYERKYKRASTAILLDMAPVDSLTRKSRGCIVDLSLGGMAVESETDYKMDREILLSINLPIRITGKIVRKEWNTQENLYNYGIEYTKISFFDKLRLKKYVKTLIKLLTGARS
ncbi:MAG: hypothetical protein AUJ85_03880 [Elusimicrobia bacterium CG1_02_37_114]|nr:MAG: hypothetical protein AUJ85_03880 [Elusimicrobia bacterium CG1_02_37_114]PIV53486.1 MAG: hypothetical protein COS17_03610 [Elusimicrobia bacterium CG02_land_8_20_14_3_00_37_13]PIZ13952.1 MAG: hypothetical protein COY53_02155 [Elusimicrobia bacterium CG_4_10_14_0_8_um_filter_37_32]